MAESVNTIVLEQGIATVHRPVLSKEEYERRLKQINDAAVSLLREKIRNERENTDERVCI